MKIAASVIGCITAINPWGGQMAKALETDKTEAFMALAAWTPTGKDEELKELAAFTERSLKEVKGLTEYEDNKAQRILAAVAFLAALAGAMFGLASKSLFEAHALGSNFAWSSVNSWLAMIVYGLFAFYAVLLASGAAKVILAIKPKFNIPPDWKPDPNKRFPQSFLFFRTILNVAPEHWVEAYAKSDVPKIRNEYIKNSVMETYLVAEKIKIKLGPLEEGIELIVKSTIVLLFWLPFAILAVGFAHP